jgi:uncharacterized membrane protein YfcA
LDEQERKVDEDEKARALKSAWEVQTRFSATAEFYKMGIERWRGPLIVLSLLGAALGTFSHELQVWFAGKVEPGWLPSAVGVASVICLSFAAYLTKELLDPEAEKKWIRARAISEAIKALALRCAAGAPPFDAAKAADRLDEEVRKVTSGIVDLELQHAKAGTSSGRPEHTITPDEYRKIRAELQRAWFEANAKKNRSRHKKWWGFSIGLALLSIVLSAVGSMVGRQILNAWVPVVTTAMAVVGSFVLANRFAQLAALYGATEFQLAQLINRPRAKNKVEEHKFVEDCEALLSWSNQTWMAEWSKRGTSERG